MRTLRNLSWFLFAFVLTIWAGVASAQDYYYRVGPQAEIFYDAAPDGACIAYFATRGYTFDSARPISGSTSFNCLRKTAGSPQSVTNATRQQCTTLKPVWDQNAKVCKAPDEPPKCEAGVPGTGTWPAGKTGGPYPAGSVIDTGGCIAGCKIDVIEVLRCSSLPNGNDVCTWKYETTGTKCTPGDGSNPPVDPPSPDAPRTDVPPFDAPKGPCPRGSVQVGVNADGIPRCQGTGSEPKNPQPKPPTIEKEDTKDNGDGSSTTTKTTVTSNADGSKTTVTTTTVTASDGTKTTTEARDTTKAPSSGSPGKDDSKKDEEKYDLCKQNPNLTICKNSTVFGRCGEITCEGDAIGCATLRAAAAMQCTQDKERDDFSKQATIPAGNQIIGGADPLAAQIKAVLQGDEHDFSKPTIEDEGFLGAGACLAPITFTFSGKPITANFESVCKNIQPLRYVIMAAAYILVYLMVARSILGGQ